MRGIKKKLTPTKLPHLRSISKKTESIASKEWPVSARVSTRYIFSKHLTNAKISLASFIYDCIDTFCFPNDETKQIYAHHKIIKILPFLLMTDTDSVSLELIVIAKDSCDCGEWKMRDILLRIVLENDIQYRLDLSGEF